MYKNKLYFAFKFLIPRRIQIEMRRHLVNRMRSRHSDIWPIDSNAGKPPDGWSGWPSGKKFALVLTHDVERAGGLKGCIPLAEMEERLGFRSSFNFVAGDYAAPPELRRQLAERGFEVGMHGINHDKNPFRSKAIFKRKAAEINRILGEWDAVGFRSPSMYHDLDLLHYLDIEYDASTFDTDPFEPQPDGMGTIFPLSVSMNGSSGKGYVELPYTLPQDFLLFVLMKERTIDVWKRKLDWIVSHGGMAMLITHPDYMNFGDDLHYEKYPARYYEEFLDYVASKYEGEYWHALPRDIARFCSDKSSDQMRVPGNATSLPPAPLPSPSPQPIHACMLVYSFYESDNRVMRYAEALASHGDSVDVIALGKGNTDTFEEEIRGVRVYRIQTRMIDETGKMSYLLKLVAFLFNSLTFLTIKHLKDPYDLIHVHSVPDFEVFSTFLPRLSGAKIILDIHDIVPEFYASKFHENKNSILFKALVLMERLSCKYADHVIISNHIWEKTLLARSVEKCKCTVIMNYPDESIFYQRPRERDGNKFIMIYPGTLGWHQGLDIAIQAFAAIKDEAPEMEFHIYGRGPERKKLELMVTDLGLDNRVFIKGLIPIEQIANVMANADLGIVPKRDDPFGGQAFSTKILEFMSLGVPLIAAETKIDRLYFNDSVLKFFKPEDVNDLAQSMLLLRSDKAMRDRLRENAQRFVQNNYSWERKKQEYIDLVKSLIKDKRN